MIVVSTPGALEAVEGMFVGQARTRVPAAAERYRKPNGTDDQGHREDN